MIGIIIVGHAPFATGLLGAARMIFGELNQVQALNLEHDTNPDEFVQDVLQAIQALDAGAGVLVLVDLLGGSPGNAVAYHLATMSAAMAVTGANLPMLLEALGSREVYNLEELVPVVMAAGRAGVEDVTAWLKP